MHGSRDIGRAQCWQDERSRGNVEGRSKQGQKAYRKGGKGFCCWRLGCITMLLPPLASRRARGLRQLARPLVQAPCLKDMMLPIHTMVKKVIMMTVSTTGSTRES